MGRAGSMNYRFAARFHYWSLSFFFSLSLNPFLLRIVAAVSVAWCLGRTHLGSRAGNTEASQHISSESLCIESVGNSVKNARFIES